MKPTLPKGTRDFTPSEMKKRNYIFNTIREVFEMYSYQQIQTPAMEMMSTLMGKYGDEGDRLIFKILKRGESLKAAFDKNTEGIISQSDLAEEALRYDLTVPFARYVVMHRNDITFPFKRFQIQPVWRADRPQKGRYREFYQCDADVIGSDSLLNEVELVQILSDVFRKLQLDVVIKINNRKILSGIAEIIGFPDKIIDITVAIDKLDKIRIDKVNEELLQHGISENAINKLQPFLLLEGSNKEKLGVLKNSLSSSQEGMKGIEEVEFILGIGDRGLGIGEPEVELDLSLARGLNYYTGAIFEVKSKEAQMGSISGGGRYDNLTGIFGLPGVSGVGISFGVDRIYDVMEQLGKPFGDEMLKARVLFANLDSEGVMKSMEYANRLRKEGIVTEVYPDTAKLKKQLEYADKNNFTYVIFIGSEELLKNEITLKYLNTGRENERMSIDRFIDLMKGLHEL